MYERRRSAITNITCYYWACALAIWQCASFYQSIGSWFWNCPRIFILKHLYITPTYIGCVGFVLGVWSGCRLKLATNLHLIPKCGKRESRLRYLQFPMAQLPDAGPTLCNLMRKCCSAVQKKKYFAELGRIISEALLSLSVPPSTFFAVPMRIF